MERKIGIVRRRSAAKKCAKVVDGGKGKEGHTKHPEHVVVAGGRKTRSTPSQPPLKTNEKAIIVHCAACPEFMPCVEVMQYAESLLFSDLSRTLPYYQLTTTPADSAG